MDCSLLGSSVHGIFQARVLEWAAITVHLRMSYFKAHWPLGPSGCGMDRMVWSALGAGERGITFCTSVPWALRRQGGSVVHRLAGSSQVAKCPWYLLR